MVKIKRDLSFYLLKWKSSLWQSWFVLSVRALGDVFVLHVVFDIILSFNIYLHNRCYLLYGFDCAVFIFLFGFDLASSEPRFTLPVQTYNCYCRHTLVSFKDIALWMHLVEAALIVDLQLFSVHALTIRQHQLSYFLYCKNSSAFTALRWTIRTLTSAWPPFPSMKFHKIMNSH